MRRVHDRFAAGEIVYSGEDMRRALVAIAALKSALLSGESYSGTLRAHVEDTLVALDPVALERTRGDQNG